MAEQAVQEKKAFEEAVKQQQAAEERKKAEEAKPAGEKKEAIEEKKVGEKKEVAAAKVEQKPAEKKFVLERVMTVPLRKAFRKPLSARAASAVKLLREFVARHLKSENVRIGEAVNKFIESRGARHPPKRVKVRAGKIREGIVFVELAA